MQKRLMLFILSACLLAVPGLSPAAAQGDDALHAQTPSPIQAIAWSPDDSRIAVGYQDGTIQIVDAAAGQVTHTLLGHTERLTTLAWKADGSELISGDLDLPGEVTARVWDTTTGEQLAVLSGISPAAILAVGWSLDQSQIITFGFDSNPNLRFWDAATYQLLTEADRGGDAFQIVWSPDETLVALANIVGKVIIADPNDFEILMRLEEAQTSEGVRGGVYRVAWSPDSEWVASGNNMGTVRLWRVSDGQNLLNLDGASNTEDRAGILALYFNADGTRISAFASDATLRTWDTNTGAVVHSEILPGAPFFAAAWSSDGSRLAYGGESGDLAVFDLLNANAGPDQALPDLDGSGGEAVTLDGSASTWLR